MDTNPESVGQILERLSTGTLTQGQKTSEPSPPGPSRQQMLDQLRRSMRVTSFEHTFANFKHLPGTDAAYRAFLAMATQDDCRPFLLCYGGVGNGKTYLCEALAIEWYKRGKFTRVLTMNELIRNLKSAMRQDSGLPDMGILVERACKAARLIIDDVGMGGSDTAWAMGQLEEIVVYRYHERLPTVMTTNQDVKNLPERVYSRFCDPDIGCVVLNEGPDFRRR